MPGGVVDPGQGPGGHFQDQAVRGAVVSARGEFGGVASEPLHLVHGENDPAMRGVALDVPGGGNRLRESRNATGYRRTAVGAASAAGASRRPSRRCSTWKRACSKSSAT